MADGSRHGRYRSLLDRLEREAIQRHLERTHFIKLSSLGGSEGNMLASRLRAPHISLAPRLHGPCAPRQPARLALSSEILLLTVWIFTVAARADGRHQANR